MNYNQKTINSKWKPANKHSSDTLQLAFNCKNIKNGQNPKVEAQMEIDIAIKSKKRSIGKKQRMENRD
jgi:hypothetical protein